MSDNTYAFTARAATPEELAARFMDPNRPKSEAEHWAVQEIEKLRVEVERLQQEDTRTRHALKGWVWVCPDGGDEPTHERVSAVVSEVERLREQLEVERMRVVACGAVALADTPESATEARKMYRDCRSASLCTVEFMVDESIALRAENVQLRAETEQLRDILRRVSVQPDKDRTVKISFFSEGDSVAWSVYPQTSWAREVLAEFEQDRLLALEENP